MEGRIDIRALIQKLISKWYYFLFAPMIIVPLVYAYTEFTDSIYQVQATILLTSPTKNGVAPEKFLKGMELLNTHTEIEDEMGILKSHNLVGSTVRKLPMGVSYFEKQGLKTFERYDEYFPFEIELDSTINQIVGVPIFVERTSNKTFSVHASGTEVGTFNFYTDEAEELLPEVDIHSVWINNKPFDHENLKFKVKFTEPYEVGHDEGKYFFVIHDLDGLTKQYAENLQIKPISRESNIVEVNLKGKVPRKGILFVNSLLDVYLINELKKRNQLGIKTIEFIDDQLSGVSDELRQVEASLESFRSRNNILDISATAENLSKSLERLETDKSKLEIKLKYYKAIASSLNTVENLTSIDAPSAFGMDDPLLNDLLLELSRLSQERTGLKYSTREGNPVAEVIDLKIANHKKALMENVNNFIEATSIALGDLNRQIRGIEGTVRGLPRSERELVNIQRRFDFNDNVYNYLLEKRAEAGIAIASNTIEKTIVDRAKQVGTGPVFPNKRLFLILAFMVSFLLAVGLIIVKDLMNDNIITMKDLEESTKIPYIGAISHGSRRDRASTIVAHTRSELGESFRSLRVNLQYLTLGKQDNVIGVTSSIANEGKTFCSINLAASLALSGRKTVIIDADLRRPRIASSFHLKNDIGLSTFLIGGCSVHEMINRTPMEGLDVITSGPIPPNPLELIGLPTMEDLIGELKKDYNTIIIDSPPVGFVSEYIILMKYTNANIYVVRSNYTSRVHLDKINRLYRDKKIRNVSVLLNDAKTLNGYSYAYS